MYTETLYTIQRQIDFIFEKICKELGESGYPIQDLKQAVYVQVVTALQSTLKYEGNVSEEQIIKNRAKMLTEMVQRLLPKFDKAIIAAYVLKLTMQLSERDEQIAQEVKELLYKFGLLHKIPNINDNSKYACVFGGNDTFYFNLVMLYSEVMLYNNIVYKLDIQGCILLNCSRKHVIEDIKNKDYLDVYTLSKKNIKIPIIVTNKKDQKIYFIDVIANATCYSSNFERLSADMVKIAQERQMTREKKIIYTEKTANECITRDDIKVYDF